MVEGSRALSWSISCWLMYLVGKTGYLQRNWLLDNYDDGDLYQEKSTLSHHYITEPRLVLSQKIVAKKEGCGPPEGSSIMPVPGST